MKKLISLLAILLLVSGAAMASSSFLGTSGTILTPDDTVLPASGFSANYAGLSLNDTTPNIVGANVGVNGTFELGLTRVDTDNATGDIETVVNAKYLALDETASRPSLVFGAVDLTGALDPDGDGGFYAILGKSLTSVASDMTGRPSMPLHGYVGYGTGIYDGFFAGLGWTLSPRLKIMGEYIKQVDIKDVLAGESMFNFGAAFTFNQTLSGQLALLDGEDLGFGLFYNKDL